uniref:Uncharacterized protein n=1 Tax=Picea sitchensis TaxID=3332 RepID=A9P2N9_PICSI|nr:unknown [Picea sitchensis]
MMVSFEIYYQASSPLTKTNHQTARRARCRTKSGGNILAFLLFKIDC